jgi:glycosyltransferase involved in cell wall biosynthesis
VHFMGRVPYDTYVDVLHVSKVHAYWTTPFVLSWSFLEAVASGVPLIASDTKPLHEFANRFSVQIVSFFANAASADALSQRLSLKSSRLTPSRQQDIDIRECLKQQISLIHRRSMC